MKVNREKNIEEFNQDVKKKGGYQYTDPKITSASIATKKQTDELIRMIKKNSKGRLCLVDVGCGDGYFTFELYRRIKPNKVIAFDSAKEAILIAQKNARKKKIKKIKFVTGNIYDSQTLLKNEKIDIIIVRGVLHHLYNPQKAIKALSKVGDKIIVLEPNGYNPILKVIEKISPYHRQHEEKSYWPPSLNKWFEHYGYKVIEQKFFGIVPYFCNASISGMLKKSEPYFERIPIIHRLYCGTNLVFYEK